MVLGPITKEIEITGATGSPVLDGNGNYIPLASDNTVTTKYILEGLINVEDLTTGELDGTGVFDKLLQACTLHLKREFDADRITKNDYAGVYTQMISAAMQTAASYGLQKRLTDAQVLKLEKDKELVDAQIDKTAKDIQLLTAQITLLGAQAALTSSKTLSENKQHAVDGVIDRQINLYNEQASGYRNDRAVKSAKLYTDIKAVMLNTNELTVVDPAALSDGNIATAMGKVVGTT